MKKSQNHIIGKVFLEINTNRKDKAEELKNNINSFLETHLFPQLEMLFDGYGNDAIYRFEKIELTLSVDKWENMQLIPTEVTKQLLAEIKTNPPVEIENTKQNTRIISENANSKELLLFFLENGFLPWYGNAEQLEDFFRPKKAEELFADVNFVKKIEKLIQKNEYAFRRLVYQFPSELVLKLLIFSNIRLRMHHKNILVYLNRLDVGLRFYVLALVYTVNIEMNKKKKELKIQGILVEIKKRMSDSEFQTLVGFVRKNIFASEKVDPGISVKISDGFSNRHIFDGTGSDDEVNQIDKNAEATETDVEAYREDFFKEVGSRELMVQNAGLVILHPFISQFFRNLEITDKKGSIKKGRLELAVHLVHYLATGEEHFFEGTMVFEKFLCGHPLKMPVRSESLLNDNLRNESDVMMQEVIRQWPALKNTSPDGLRQMFFQRNGKLIKKDKNYKLIVERKAQDMLLEKLNWNITVIKLPWKRDLLFVEW